MANSDSGETLDVSIGAQGAPADLEAAQKAIDEANEEIVENAKDFFELAKEAESELRSLALEDLEFISGKQWPDKLQQDRDIDGRPCLVINRLPQFVQQVTNDQRQNRPSIKVHPVSDGADVETAKIIQGLIRHIEYNSNAEVAYDTALESAVRGGFGYFRIITDFVSPDSFDQEIFIKRVRNPFSVYFDPYSQEPDGSDAQRAMIVDGLSKDDYKAKYPQSKLATDESLWSATGSNLPSWFSNDGCVVAEFFYKEMQEKTIHLLETGETVDDKNLFDRQMKAHAAGLSAGVVRSRVSKVPVVKWCKLNGVEVLEQTEWVGSYIPIIPVYGSEIILNGKRILESVVRHAKDPQRMLNYWKSAETEAIALAPRAPFIVAEGQLEGYERDWESANRRNHAYLYYKPTTIAGQPAPSPQRQAAEPAVQAITQASMGAIEDLNATTGIYPAAMGAQSNEVSGVAIRSRTNQAQTAVFHFTDNLTRSLKHAGRILVDLIPSIYDTARAARIIGDDGSQEMVRLNQKYTDPDTGKQVLYDLAAGRYDVTVDTGPSFASKRQEAAAAMVEVARSYPQLLQLAGDIFIKNQDWPGAQDIAERIKKSLPPQLTSDPKQQQVPPQIQAQMAQMGKMIDALQGELSEATKVIETKKLDIEHKERVELMKLQAQIEMKAAELGSKEDLALLNHQVAQIESRLSLLQMNAPVEAPNDFNPEQADGGNYPGIGHIGGSENLTGGASPGQNPGEHP